MSVTVLARKISDYCRIRVAELLSPRETEQLRRYLLGLIHSRTKPPRANAHYNWVQIADASGLSHEVMLAVGPKIRPGIDALVRGIQSLPPLPKPKPKRERQTKDASPPGKKKVSELAGPKARKKPKISAPPQKRGRPLGTGKTTKPEARPAAKGGKSNHTFVDPVQKISKRRGPSPRPIVEFPMPLWPDPPRPELFKDALVMQMRRHGETTWALNAQSRPLGSHFATPP